MATAAWVLAGLLALGAALLAVPLGVELRLDGEGAAPAVRLRWLFGLVTAEPGGGEAAAGDAPERSEREEEPGDGEDAARRGPGPRAVLRALRSPGLGPSAGRLLRRTVGAVRLVRADGRVRLADPADTGRLWAVVGPATAILAPGDGAPIRLRPDFSPGGARVTGSASLRVVPLRLVAGLLAFVCSPPVIRAGWRLARAG